MTHHTKRTGAFGRLALAAAVVGVGVGLTSCRVGSEEEKALTTTREVAVASTGPGALEVRRAGVVDREANARIRAEGLERSQVMETLNWLTTVNGPRLTGSPGMKRANEWSRDKLAEWGLSGARLESWGEFGRGWEVERFSMQAVSPVQWTMIAAPRAWSSGWSGEAEVVHVDATTLAGLEKYKGQLAGKVVFVGQVRDPEARWEPLATRQTDEALARLEQAGLGSQAGLPVAPNTDTASERRGLLGQLGRRPPTTAAARQATRPTTGPATRPGRGGNDPVATRALSMAVEEGAVMVVTTGGRGDGGVMTVQSAAVPADSGAGGGGGSRPRPWAVPAEKVPPQVTVSVEDFNRVARNLAAGKPVRVAVEYKPRETDGRTQWNTIAEIPGSELPNEVVYVGAHLDSWHSATGTTDNGVGSAAVMEAVRIIQAAGLRPKRTIRVALWSGEEQGLLGSNAYVKEHYGHIDPPTTWGEPRPTTRRLVKTDRHETVMAYFNLDNGTGKVRGIYAQGNTEAAAYFRTWLAEFKDLQAGTVTLSDTGSTDHIAFDSVGIPGFQFIQDPIEYGTRTWHTNQDFYERAQAADLKQASTVMASVLWHVANMEGMFPRKAEPGR